MKIPYIDIVVEIILMKITGCYRVASGGQNQSSEFSDSRISERKKGIGFCLCAGDIFWLMMGFI